MLFCHVFWIELKGQLLFTYIVQAYPIFPVTCWVMWFEFLDEKDTSNVVYEGQHKNFSEKVFMIVE